MLKSMTGFGRGIAEKDECKVSVDIKSVNNRFFDAQFRMPRELSSLEPGLRQLCQKKVARGKLDVSVSWSFMADSSELIVADLSLAKSYADAIGSIAAEIGAHYAFVPDPLKIASFPQVLKSSTKDTDMDFWQNLLNEACAAALDNLLIMRETEGRWLQSDIKEKAGLLRSHRLTILEHAPEVVVAYRERLQEKLNLLLGERVNELFDENRLAAEVLVFADKANVDEELVRLDSHLSALDEILDADGSNGKKLDFLIQEINREINTIGSKANDLAITTIVVEMKSALEKIREQVQNIE